MIESLKTIYVYATQASTQRLLEILRKIILIESLGDYEQSLVQKVIDLIESQNENPEWELDYSLIRLIDFDVLQQFINKSTDKSLEESAVFQLRLLAAATGLVDNLMSYNIDVLFGIFNGKIADYDPARYLYTLRQAIRHEEHHDIALQAFILLGKIDKHTSLSLLEVTERLLVLRVIWNEFPNMPDEARIYFLEHWFYSSIILGVPVGEFCKNWVYSTTTLVEMMLVSKEISDSLAANEENFFDSNGNYMDESIGSWLKNYRDEIKTEIADLSKVKYFIQRLYPVSAHQFIVDAASMVLDVFVRASTATLVDRTLGGEETEADIYVKELAELITYTADQKEWPKLKEYYKQKKPLVPIDHILRQIRLNMDIAKPATIDYLLPLFDFLKKEKLVSSYDIIVYHESDNQFHWNDDLFKQ
ncbi:MAG: hypothetical protein KBD73_02035 [Candidatus Magasanikbacteria bacterium]|nr:hypothetical protein [Candidatus Magasanikbacteria bacterium]